MRKLKFDVVKKMYKSKLSSAELNFIFYVSLYQDESGQAKGIFYKDVCDQLEISNQTFYDILKSLKKKDIINYNRDDFYDYMITILDNDFTGIDLKDKNTTCRYLDMSKKVFNTKEFYSLKANEKLIFIDLVLKYGFDWTKSFRVNKETLIDNYSIGGEYSLGITKRKVREYLNSLDKTFFNIGGGYIRIKENTCKDDTNKGIPLFDSDYINCNIIKKMVRKNKIKAKKKEIYEVAGLIRQYEKRALEKNFTVEQLIENIELSIEITLKRKNNKCRSKRKWERYLIPSYVHKILRDEKMPELKESVA